MISGYQVRNSIDDRLAKQRHEERLLEDRLNLGIEELQTINNNLANEYRELALFKLNSLDSNNYKLRISNAEDKAATLMLDRRKRLEVIDKRIDKIEDKIKEFRHKRDEADSSLKTCETEIDAKTARITSEIEKTDKYGQLMALIKDKRATLLKAREKLEQALEDRQKKGKPYEQDPLFVYLWRSGYGTSKYASSNLIRFCDSRIAHMIDFFNARPNYTMLIALPDRLGEHVQQLEEELRTKATVINQQIDARLKDEASDVLATIASSDAEIKNYDSAIEQLEKKLDEAVNERTRYADGQDPYAAEALDLLVDTIKSSDSRHLYEEAKKTRSEKDDIIVRRITKYNDQARELKKRLKRLRKILRANKEQRVTLEGVRKDFVKKGYNRSRVGFVQGAVAGVLLDNLLQGAIGRRDYWSGLQENVRVRNDGGFLSGGGFGDNDSGFTSGGGFGGGGFTSGGGFGGGGGGFTSGGDF